MGRARTAAAHLPVYALAGWVSVAGAAADEKPERFFDQKFECLMEPSLIVKLGTPVEGIVSEVLVDRADRVKAGQVIAKMEARVETALLALAHARAANTSQISSAKTRYEFLLRKAERLSGLLEKSVGSKAAYDEARSEADVALQQFNEAKDNQELAKLDEERADAVLQLRTIVSPIDGVVTERLMAPGEYRNGQAHLATIARTDPLNVEVVVPEAYFGKIEKGMSGRVELDAPVGGVYSGLVTVIDEILDAKSGTFGVRLSLPNPDHKAPAGLGCHVQFLAPGTNG